jgi:UDP-N-acetyl-D-glucosamine/UDP-N-acetyl-D-galactosamine dehydrogenase
VNPQEAQHEYAINVIDSPRDDQYDGIIVTVAHEQFKQMSEADIRRLGRKKHVLYDLKYILNKSQSDIRL